MFVLLTEQEGSITCTSFATADQRYNAWQLRENLLYRLCPAGKPAGHFFCFFLLPAYLQRISNGDEWLAQPPWMGYHPAGQSQSSPRFMAEQLW